MESNNIFGLFDKIMDQGNQASMKEKTVKELKNKIQEKYAEKEAVQQIFTEKLKKNLVQQNNLLHSNIVSLKSKYKSKNGEYCKMKDLADRETIKLADAELTLNSKMQELFDFKVPNKLLKFKVPDIDKYKNLTMQIKRLESELQKLSNTIVASLKNVRYESDDQEQVTKLNIEIQTMTATLQQKRIMNDNLSKEIKILEQSLDCWRNSFSLDSLSKDPCPNFAVSHHSQQSHAANLIHKPAPSMHYGNFDGQIATTNIILPNQIDKSLPLYNQSNKLDTLLKYDEFYRSIFPQINHENFDLDLRFSWN